MAHCNFKQFPYQVSRIFRKRPGIFRYLPRIKNYGRSQRSLDCLYCNDTILHVSLNLDLEKTYTFYVIVERRYEMKGSYMFNENIQDVFTDSPKEVFYVFRSNYEICGIAQIESVNIIKAYTGR